MAVISKKSYDQDGHFIDVVRYDTDTGVAIDRTRHEPYFNPWDAMNGDLGEVIEKEDYNK